MRKRHAKMSYDMIETYTQGTLTWVDVLNPTPDEVRALLETYQLPPSLLGDLAAPVPQSRALSIQGVIKVTMDFPIVKREDIERAHELKFLITKHALISVRYEDMGAIDQFKREFEVIGTLYKTNKHATGAHLFFALLRTLYNALDTKLDYLESKMNDIQREMFDNREKELVFVISKTSRRVLTFRQVLKTHERVFASLEDEVEECFGESVSLGLAEEILHGEMLTTRTHSLFEAFEELRETNFALLTTKQNQIMTVLTIMAFITFPLSLFTSMFGMNTTHTPILGHPNDFWIIVGIMTVVTIGFFGFFKYKKWM
ncbi:hypothetical protein GW943_01515 [Candidatus Parcubacteria bacterium]|uniref:Magnesium transporter CorA n=1 Tax=Candidatus Kaiserbacteria bacterium CG10_big_fil_rev_8_21_14_0_10_47_16 TaxID=1974608 RepID=A0A2H0UE63_9BACT|nr:hypothetical protein [Candidatus Parcubacteria bacterium]PIR84713.1 MAG: hypothetical protein COU16_00810 [Candidatus Kaiserbacteria bacterium CG10_big_fil_rev_8_21_14_0_10_47_16]